MVSAWDTKVDADSASIFQPNARSANFLWARLLPVSLRCFRSSKNISIFSFTMSGRSSQQEDPLKIKNGIRLLGKERILCHRMRLRGFVYACMF